MLKVYLMLVLSAASAVFAESVRETETWVPLKNKSPHEDLESSGDSSHEDFEFSPNPVGDKNGFEDDDEDDDDDVVDDYDDLSGSGSSEIPTTEDIFNNWIPDPEGPFAPRPTIDEKILVEENEVGLRNSPNRDLGQPSNVLMTVAEEESLFSNTEVLAAVIAGAAVGLVFAILLIVLLVHFVLRIKKKDEGSYDLGKTPIYKKAPTAEIYA